MCAPDVHGGALRARWWARRAHEAVFCGRAVRRLRVLCWVLCIGRAPVCAVPHLVLKWRGVPWADKAATPSSVGVRDKKRSSYQKGYSPSLDKRLAGKRVRFARRKRRVPWDAKRRASRSLDKAAGEDLIGKVSAFRAPRNAHFAGHTTQDESALSQSRKVRRADFPSPLSSTMSPGPGGNSLLLTHLSRQGTEAIVRASQLHAMPCVPDAPDRTNARRCV